MLKNTEKIKKLNLDEKISLVADGKATFTQGNKKAEINPVTPISWDEVNIALCNLYPDIKTMACSWNNLLIGQVAKDISSKAKQDGANLLYSPELRVKSNPYTNGLSEDSYFVRSQVYQIVSNIKSVGIAPCVTGCSLKNSDIRYLDTKMSLRTIRDYFFSPYTALSAFEGSAISSISYTKLSGTYSEVNTEVLSNMLTKIADKKGGHVICTELEGDSSVACAMKYTLSLKGTPQSIRQAFDNANYIKESMNTGDASGYDLEIAREDYTAVCEEDIDAALDKIISFSEYCNIEDISTIEAPPKLALNVATESIVLLKNTNSILPLKHKKIAIIGEIANDEIFGTSFKEQFTQNCVDNGCQVVGYAKGYDIGGNRKDSLLSECMQVSNNAEIVLLFLSPEKEDTGADVGGVKLPANRIEVVDMLLKNNKKVVCILNTNAQIDMSFDSKLSAVLMAPMDSKYSVESLTNVLLGLSNPSGKLTSTLYDKTDEFFNKIKNYKNTGKLKVGGFIGYRYYDTCQTAVKYPFGHGLSYTTFAYSNIKIVGNEVEFTIKNTGAVAGSEVVQLYIGKSVSNILRPKKELKGYEKVFLQAGESKTVQFMVDSKMLAVYDEEKRKSVVEDGEYDIYICSSVKDVKLAGKMRVSGDYISKENKKFSDYFLNASNVLSNGYTLQNVQVTSKKGRGAIMFSTICMAFIALSFSIIAAVNALGVFDNILGETPILGFLKNKILLLAGIASASLFGLMTIILLIGIALQIYAKKHPSTVVANTSDKLERRHPFEELFLDEFAQEEKVEEQVKVTEEKFDEEQEALRFMDSTLNLKVACSQFMAYSKSCGVNIDTVSAAKILGAFASSRLIILRNKNTSLLKELMDVISGYFGTQSYIDEFADYQNFEDYMTENCISCIDDATKLRQNVHILSLANVALSSVRSFFAPLLKYISSPTSAGVVKYGYDKKLTLPPNLWFVFALPDGAKPTADDAFVFSTGAFIDVNIASCTAATEKAQVKFFSYYQLVRMADMVAESNPLDEDNCWKKTDKLEKYVNAHTPYTIGNKLWFRTEKFASAILACGASQNIALDCTLSSLLLPAIFCMLKGKISSDEGSIASMLDSIFGEENVAESKKILTVFGLSTV